MTVSRFWPSGGSEFEGAHAARSDIAKPFDGIEALGCSALGGQPRIDQGIAEAIGQGIGQHSGQAVEGFVGELGVCIDALIERHHQRRDLDTAAGKFRRVLKCRCAERVLNRDGAD